MNNCTISSRMNAIRVGVGNGQMLDVTFLNIAIHDTRTVVTCFGDRNGS